MRAKAFVIGLTVVVAIGGGYLYQATRGQTTSPAPTPAAEAPSARGAPAPGPRAARPLDAVAPAASGAPPRAGAAATPPAPSAATAPPLPVGTPGVHIDVRDRLDDAPGMADPTDRARGDLAAPPLPVAVEAADALAEARTAFRASDYTAARSIAKKVLAIAPDNDAARRLAVSSSCRLRDAAGARADAAAIAADQRAAVVRYCATAGVSLDPAP